MSRASSSETSVTQDSFKQRLSLHDCWVALIPLAAATVVLLLSPSYRRGSYERESPPGSDFLQEWIGATIVLHGDERRLYDWEFAKTLQHDSSLTGFQWPDGQYYPMVYPPFYYVLIQPLAAIDVFTASRIWCLFNGAAFGLAFAMLARHLSRFGRSALWFMWVAAAYSPVLLSLNMGQKSGFIFLIFVASFHFLATRRPMLAGAVFGALLFKPHLAVIVLAAMVWKRQWRFVCGFFAIASVFCWVSFSMGANTCLDFAKIATTAAGYMNHDGYRLEHAQNLWCAVCSHAEIIGVSTGPVAFWLIAAILIWGLVAAMSGPIKNDSFRFAEQYGFMILLTVLLSPHFFTYDLSVLIFPMAVALARIGGCHWRSPKIPSSRVSDETRSLGLIESLLTAEVAVTFLFSGWFPTIALSTGIPPASILMTVWVLCLSRCLKSPRIDVDQTEGRNLMVPAAIAR